MILRMKTIIVIIIISDTLNYIPFFSQITEQLTPSNHYIIFNNYF